MEQHKNFIMINLDQGRISVEATVTIKFYVIHLSEYYLTHSTIKRVMFVLEEAIDALRMPCQLPACTEMGIIMSWFRGQGCNEKSMC